MAKSKEKKKSSQPSKRWEMYTVKGDKVEKRRACPECGPGIFLAKHEKPKKRQYCGRCHYVEYEGTSTA